MVVIKLNFGEASHHLGAQLHQLLRPHAAAGATALETLQQGLASVLCALPPGSMLGVYCVETLLHKCRALEAGGRWGRLPLLLDGMVVACGGVRCMQATAMAAVPAA